MYNKQLLDSVFVRSRISKVSVKVISRRLMLITLKETLIIQDITNTSSTVDRPHESYADLVSGPENIYTHLKVIRHHHESNKECYNTAKAFV